MAWKLHEGDCLTVLKEMSPGTVQTCITSPPYYGLRDYGVSEQLGLEQTPVEYVENMVKVFREVKRVLRDDGTLWLNLGDTYIGGGRGDDSQKQKTNRGSLKGKDLKVLPNGIYKRKDLIGIPWLVAFALQADGWWLRCDIIWHKPNPMPESVTDRPTKAHEYIFLLSKSQQYYYDHEAVKEPAGENMEPPAGSAGAFGPAQSRRRKSGNKERKINAPSRLNTHKGSSIPWEGNSRNKRTVWTIASQPFKAEKSGHFATFPPKLIEPCVLAGCPPQGTVLDPFAGAGTTLLVSERLGRNSIGIEISPEYCEIIKKRMAGRQSTVFEFLNTSAISKPEAQTHEDLHPSIR